MKLISRVTAISRHRQLVPFCMTMSLLILPW